MMAGSKYVHHPNEIKKEDPFQREERLPTGFGCKKTSPGDEDGSEPEGDFGEGRGGGRVGENPDEEWDEENDLFVRDCAGVNEIGEESDERQNYYG
jgi:hypothetical protein